MKYVIPIFLFAGLVICICGILFFGKDYIEADTVYKKLGEQYVTEQLNADDALRYQIDWDSLRAVNPDIVGWIVVPGTKINYPIVQASDNDTYLHKSFEGEKNSCGTLFMDSLNHSDFSDLNTIIYGHNMRNGSMFRALNEYNDPDYYATHKEIWICTPSWQRRYQIISAHLTKSTSATYTVAFADGEYERFIGREISESAYDSGNGYDTSLPSVTLSTCNGRNSDKRMVLITQPVYEVRIGI